VVGCEHHADAGEDHVERGVLERHRLGVRLAPLHVDAGTGGGGNRGVPGAGGHVEHGLLDLVGDRWSLLILRDLYVGTSTFNGLARGLPGLSRSLLAKRLRSFEREGLVEKIGGRYLMTERGRDLEGVLMALGNWGSRWIFGDPREEELDAQLLVWWMHGRLDTAAMPLDRWVLHVRFLDDPRRFWILVEDRVPSVCLSDPGYGVDVTIASDVRTLYRVWLGQLPLSAGLRHGLSIEGPCAVVRRVPNVLQLSPMGPLVSGALALHA
jgi:DNA-binding HxlR family transcriptional regulator